MADIKDDEDGEELVMVGDGLEDEDTGTPEPKKEAKADDAEDDDDDDVEDRRLSAEDDDDDEGGDDDGSPSRKRRLRRRKLQRKAREESERELAMLREQNQMLNSRLSRLETGSAQSYANDIDASITQALRDIRTAEDIMAKALQANNGEDHVTALRLRDQARDRAQRLQFEKTRLEQTSKQPAVDPYVQRHAAEWIAQNPWYDPTGKDEDSATVNIVDNELVREGYDPTTRAYWEELTARVGDRLAGDDDDDEAPAKRRSEKAGRKAPPVGSSRNHAPASTRSEVHVTPERKAAMIEAGVWDDPVRRKRALREYRAYDQANSAR